MSKGRPSHDSYRETATSYAFAHLRIYAFAHWLVSSKPQQPQHIPLIGEFHCVDVFGSAAAEFVEVGFVPRK